MLAGDDRAALEELDFDDQFDLSTAGGWAEDIDDGAEAWHSPGARQLLAASEDAATSKHVAVHAAAVKHAAHKKAARGRPQPPAPAAPAAPATAPAEINPATTESGAMQLAPSGVSLPTALKRPPVCSVPPAMRFCKSIDYPVYRPDDAHTFADVSYGL